MSTGVKQKVIQLYQVTCRAFTTQPFRYNSKTKGVKTVLKFLIVTYTVGQLTGTSLSK